MRFLRLIFWYCAAFAAPFVPLRATAQEGLRTSLAGDAATEARRQSAESMPYTIKEGDLRVLFSPSIGLEWNDNISISQGKPQQDFIIEPSLQMRTIYPLSQQNLLDLNVGFGYQKYLEHPKLDTWNLQSGTAVNFDMSIKDFWINFHDRVSYTQDPAQEPTLVGTADYATINNSVGLEVNWDLNALILTAGYDHNNTISTSKQFSSQDSATDSFHGRAGFHVNSGLTTGIEITGAFTSYDQMVLNNNSSYSFGVYADWQPGKYFHVQPRAGFTMSQFQKTSSTIQTSGQNSWYADLNISHEVSDAISYALDAGHEIKLGIQSDAVEDSYVRPNVTLNIIRNVGLSAFFSYEHGQQGVGNITGNLQETYDWMGTGFSMNYQPMKKLSVALNYRLTVRTSSSTARDYQQNTVGLTLTYQMQ